VKKFLIGLSIATLCNISLAGERTGFYLKANVGANKMNEAKEGVAKSRSLNSKSTISPSFSVGIGGYINNFIRTDLTFDYSKVSFKNATKNITINDFDEEYGNYTVVINAFLDRKASVYSMILNNYIDLPMNDNSQIFIGCGIGLAQIREKIVARAENGKAYVGNEYWHIPNYTASASTKQKLNFAYSFTVGSAIKVAPNVNIEIAYSWKDFGVTKHEKWQDDDDRPDKNRYNGYSVMTGIRFEI